MIINPRCEIQNTNLFGKKNYDQKQKAHIMPNKQCKCNAWHCLTKLLRVHKQEISISSLTLEYMYRLVYTHTKSEIA